MRTRLPEKTTSDLRRAIDAVVAGRNTYLDIIKPGLTAAQVHEAYLATLDRHGVRKWNRHSSGYSFGIAYPPYWGELRHLILAKGVEVPLQANMVLHAISGLTEPRAGVGHVGLSECLLITHNGVEKLISIEDFL
jgi:Xaa-Pro aminopeptidase